jgi:transketolase
VHHTPGVEVTTGPLGQGVANGVGMGVAERILRARFGADVCDHHTFVICSDGDLEEGISHEAASLAGHLGLGRLVYVYDDNHISIDGPTELSYSDDKVKRFEGYGWHVEELGEIANDTDALEQAIRAAMAVEDRPSILILRSHIGWPSPKFTDSAKAHGSPLGEDEVRVTKEILGLPPDEHFWVPDDALAHWREIIPRGQTERAAWEERLDDFSGDRAALDACLAGRGLTGWEQKLPTWEPGASVATRKASGQCLNAILDVVPGLVAGGADLTENTGTEIEDKATHGVQSAEQPGGRQLYYGIREHGMGAAMTGMALHGGVLPVGGTFAIFSDYMRPSVRLAAMSEAHVIYSWTHDSVGLGEDGPTHQPIEQVMSLRLIPGLRVIRPADANETALAWQVAVNADGPTALLLTRQNVPVLPGTAEGGVAMGAYTLVEAEGDPQLILIGTGSEVSVCVEAAATLAQDDIAVRVVSMPSWELFAEQDEAYRVSVLPPAVKRLAVEAGVSIGWERYADASVSIDRFGASAPGTVALRNLGYTTENVVARARDLLREGHPA